VRPNRLLRQMAGLAPTAYDRGLRRYVMRVQRANQQMLGELQLLDMVARRQRGEEGLPAMPFAKMRVDLEKMARGEL
jgi:hypothetical protein